jgi:FkbM family methyltransferase
MLRESLANMDYNLFMLRTMARKMAKGLGYEIFGAPRAFSSQTTLRGMLLHEKINLILDVGANVGQFVEEIRELGYRERIISYEPQLSAHALLLASAAKDPNWTIADRTALGAAQGTLTMHNSRNSVSSSLLPMLDSHSDAEPEAGYIDTEEVPVNRLDDICVLLPADRVLLKIDVQGFERPVLEGAQRILGRCHAVIVEMSLIPLYEGQTLAWELWDLLGKAGFEAWSFEPGFRSPQSGRMLQMDGLFIRRTQGQAE